MPLPDLLQRRNSEGHDQSQRNPCQDDEQRKPVDCPRYERRPGPFGPHAAFNRQNWRHHPYDLPGFCASMVPSCPDRPVGGGGSNRARPIGRGPVGRSNALAGRGRTCCGHQNQRPSSAAMDGVMNARTTSVSNSRPRPMVIPTWPIMTRSLTTMDIMVKANTRPADVTTLLGLPIARMRPVFIPAGFSSFIRETRSKFESDPTAKRMITDIASTTKCICMPTIYCQ